MLHKTNILFTFLILVFGTSEQNPSGSKYRCRDDQVLDNNPPIPISPQEINPPEHKHTKKPHLIQLNSPSVDSPFVQFKAPDPENPFAKRGSFGPPPLLHLNAKEIDPDKVSYVQEKIGQQWPMGVVPYVIDKEIYDTTTAKRIVNSMSVIESVSCVIFKELRAVPGDTNDTWLHITNPKAERECVHKPSIVNDSETIVVLGFECLHPDEILHALLHGIGFKDEVSHPHREQYIRVQWENIQPKYRPLFRIQYEESPYKLVEYDPLSIMHFHDRAFSANGAATITPVISGLHVGSSHTLSQLDVMKLKLAFGHECNERKVSDLLESCKVVLSPVPGQESGQNKNGGVNDNVQILEGDADGSVQNDKTNEDFHKAKDEDNEKDIQNLDTIKNDSRARDEKVSDPQHGGVEKNSLKFGKPLGRK